MSKSKLPIPAHHKETALKALEGRVLKSIFITEDGHLYVPGNKSYLNYHCQTNQKTYWEVEAPEEETIVKPEIKTGEVEIKPTTEGGAEPVLTPEQKAKINEAAAAAGAPDAELIEKLKGVRVEKLIANTKEVLLGYAESLKIAVSETDTKQVIAEEILKVVNG